MRVVPATKCHTPRVRREGLQLRGDGAPAFACGALLQLEGPEEVKPAPTTVVVMAAYDAAFLVACDQGRTASALALLDAGCNPAAVACPFNTVKDSRLPRVTGHSGLALAIRRGHDVLLLRLLERSVIPLETRDDGYYTPFLSACRVGRADCWARVATRLR